VDDRNIKRGATGGCEKANHPIFGGDAPVPLAHIKSDDDDDGLM
jgi:hypothetical protein